MAKTTKLTFVSRHFAGIRISRYGNGYASWHIVYEVTYLTRTKKKLEYITKLERGKAIYTGGVDDRSRPDLANTAQACAFLMHELESAARTVDESHGIKEGYADDEP